MNEGYACLPMEFQPCSACTRDRASCDQCFWVKEARRQATMEREAEAALDAAEHQQEVACGKMAVPVVDYFLDKREHERLKRIEAAARDLYQEHCGCGLALIWGPLGEAMEKALGAK